MKWKIGTCTVALALLLANRNVARADTLFSNIAPSTQDGADGISANTGFGPLADSFSTLGSAVNLTDVKVNLTGTPDLGLIHIDLLSDKSTAPGAFLTNLGVILDAQLSGTLTTFDVPLAVSYPLAANTRYWVQLSGDSEFDTSGLWAWSLDTSGIGVASEYFANQGGVFPNLGGPYEMEVIAGVPEPSTLILLAFGTIAVTGYRIGHADSKSHGGEDVSQCV